MIFASLHNHTTFSNGDGHRSPRAHVERFASLGGKAMAFTEHRNTSSFVQAEQACSEFGVKPIFGCEFDVAMPNEKYRRHFHQTVLAMNDQGLRNLNRLVTIAWQQTKYVPRLYVPQLLDKELTEGLIVLSGCADSLLSCVILGGKSFGDRREDWEQEDINAGRILVEQFQAVYGDRYYLECQQFPELERSTILNQAFMDLSKVTGAQPVATADVHYPYPEENVIQRCLHAATRGGLDADWEYDIRLTYPESDQQVFDALKQQQLTDSEAENAILATAGIAARCEVELPKSPRVRYVAPKHECEMDQEWCSVCGNNEFFEVPAGEKANHLLWELIQDGLDYRYETNKAFRRRYDANEKGYEDRLKHEFDVITGKDFSDYFLVTADLMRWAKDVRKMGVGPGRGSAAGSLLCYAIRITEIDPMEFPLMQFERFIDPTRPDMPDIDMDFSDPAGVFAYAAEKYGEDKVGHIANFQRYRGKSAIKAVGRTYQMPYDLQDALKSQVFDRPDGHPRENDTVTDLIESLEQPRDWTPPSIEKAQKALKWHPDIKYAAQIEGDHKGLGVHAAGMVIANRPIHELTAVYSKENSKGKQVEVVSVDKRDAEYLDVLKLDILGLSTMAIIEHVVNWTDLEFEQLYALPFTDKKVLRRFADNDLTGIFQFEGRTTRSIVKQVFAGKEEVEFLTLADINALSRPGSLISGMTARYVAIEQDEKEPRDYGYDSVNAIMDSTNRCLVYQEQVMGIGRDFAGMPGSQVGALRRIIGKKKAGGAFEKFYDEFLAGAQATSAASEKDARELWDFMATSSSYLFNIAHAVSYAVIAYWAMWIKVYHPAEFYAASLRLADKDHALELMQDAVRHGLTILPPSIQASEENWTVFRGMLQAGFSQVPNIGEDKLGMAIKKFRDETWGPVDPTKAVNFAMVYAKWTDFQYRPAPTRNVRVKCDPYMKEVTRQRTRKLPDGTKEKYKVKEWVEYDYTLEKEVTGPAQGVEGVGPAKIKMLEEFSTSDDPFGIHLAAETVAMVIRGIEDGLLPLLEPTADSEELAMYVDEDVIFVGLVKEVRIIDVIDDMARRENKPAEEIRANLEKPHLATRAKLICVDQHGTEVHVNVDRYRYQDVADDLKDIVEGKDPIHVMGTSRGGFGPTVQTRELTVIDLSEDE